MRTISSLVDGWKKRCLTLLNKTSATLSSDVVGLVELTYSCRCAIRLEADTVLMHFKVSVRLLAFWHRPGVNALEHIRMSAWPDQLLSVEYFPGS